MSLKELGEWEKSHQLKVEDFDEKVVEYYHIDTQLGLCKFAELITENNIVTEREK